MPAPLVIPVPEKILMADSLTINRAHHCFIVGDGTKAIASRTHPYRNVAGYLLIGKMMKLSHGAKEVGLVVGAVALNAALSEGANLLVQSQMPELKLPDLTPPTTTPGTPGQPGAPGATDIK